jgi:signal transduction histidine kinase
VAPLICLVAITAVSTAEFAVFGAPEGMGVALPGAIGAYSVGRYVDRKRSWWGLVLVAALWLSWDLFDPVVTTPLLRLEQLGWASPWVVAWLVGALVRSQIQHAAQRRAARSEREARAVVEERNRIARELHDVIGHSVSVMTLQASAVRRRLAADQAAERQALETVESVGREALVEMRRMVGVLRQDGENDDRHPAPGFAQVDALVDKFRDAGLPVELRITAVDREAVSGGALSPGLDLTAYRVIQEGLTNALRHAREPSHVEVVVSGDDGLEIAIRDDGRFVDGHAEPGHGLLGMRERTALYGGTLLARPRESGGFELIARFPRDPDAVHDRRGA